MITVKIPKVFGNNCECSHCGPKLIRLAHKKVSYGRMLPQTRFYTDISADISQKGVLRDAVQDASRTVIAPLTRLTPC